MDELRKLTSKCKQLYDEGDVDAAVRYYEEHIFSKVKDRVIKDAKTRGLSNHYENLMLTVGFSPRPLKLSIMALKPKNIFFLYSKKSEKFIDEICQSCSLKPSQVDKALIERADAADVYEKVKIKWNSLSHKKRTAVDLTGGTKPMVAGCGIAASLLGIDALYVDSQFGWLPKISKPGTERINRLSNPYDVFGELEINQANQQFNSHNYSVAAILFKRLQQKVSDPRPLEIASLLADGYGQWDSFNYREALLNLKRANGKATQYRIKIADNKRGKFAKHLEILKVLAKNRTDSHFNLIKNKIFAEYLIIDVFLNAERRAYQGRYDDGIIRLYRLLELISQYILAGKYNINTNDAVVADKNIKNEYTKLAISLYGYSKSLPKKVGLMDGWLLLYVLKDEITKQFSDLNGLRAFMNNLLPRNELMIEHMNQPGKINKYKDFKKSVLPWAKLTVPDFDVKLKTQKFINLPL